MNKTVTINISGFIFNIEEEAYQVLKSYLEAVRKTFTGTEGSQEIMADIEARIAELFQLKLNDRKHVIMPEDVTEIIGIMGEPEVYADHDSTSEDEKQEKTDFNEDGRNPHRKVYRDEDDSVLAGVCSGLSHHFKTDPLHIRIAFVILAFITFGTAILIYIILRIVIPEAKTTAEKLHMKGKDVTIENIRNKVNEEFKNLGDQLRSSETKTRLKNALEDVAGGMGKAFNTLGMFITKSIGLIFILIAAGLMIAAISGLIAADSFTSISKNLGFAQLDEVFLFNENYLTLGLVAIGLIIFPILSGFIYTGVRLLGGIKKQIPFFGLTLTIMFIVGFSIALFIGTRIGTQLSHDHEIPTRFADFSQRDTIIIELHSDVHFHDQITKRNSNFIELIKLNDDKIILGQGIHLYVRNGGEGPAEVEIIRRAGGPTEQEAIHFAERIGYEYQISDSLIMLDPNITIPREDHFRMQEVEVIVRVPEGKFVKFSDNVGRVYWNDNYNGRILRMGPDGLSSPSELSK